MGVVDDHDDFSSARSWRNLKALASSQDAVDRKISLLQAVEILADALVDSGFGKVGFPPVSKMVREAAARFVLDEKIVSACLRAVRLRHETAHRGRLFGPLETEKAVAAIEEFDAAMKRHLTPVLA